MRKLIIAAFAACIFSLATEAQLKTPAPSPTQTVKQDFGISTVELTYSRPSMRGRKIFGDLVPYNKIWRTGANAATRIKFGDEVTIGDQKIKAGDYVIYTIPGEKEWEVIINKGINNWGTDGYKAEDDVVRTKVKALKLDDAVESFTMQFANVKSNSCDLEIMWDQTSVSLPITTDVDKKVMAQIDNLMNKDNRPYYNAAMYYMETGRDLNQALAWFDKAIEIQPDAYWVHHQRANALAKLGRKAEARAAAEKSKELAIEKKNDDYVKLNEKLLADLK